jgi:serine O-acetyltransferase
MANDPPRSRELAASAPLRGDLEHYFKHVGCHYRGARAWLWALTEYGFLAICVYRYGRFVRTVRPRLLALPLIALYYVLEFAVHVLFGIRLSPNADIGPGLYIGHFGGIVVRGTIGRDCTIAQGVTIGAKGAGRSNGFPVIGDRVYIGAGAMVIGNVRIGNDVVIGANTVVVQDVPDGCRVVSAPARILPPRDETASDGIDRRQRLPLEVEDPAVATADSCNRREPGEAPPRPSA